jgi:hypothetical protein
MKPETLSFVYKSIALVQVEEKAMNNSNLSCVNEDVCH